MAKPIPQSDTQWIPAKKNKQGKVVSGGYVIQRSTGKKVTGKVAISDIGSTAYNTRGIATYKGGKNVNVTPSKKSPSGAGAAPKSKPSESAAKAALARRLEQNKGVKSGTVRPSANGKGLRRYNATTGRWTLISDTKVKPTANIRQAEGNPKSPASAPSTSMSKPGQKPPGASMYGKGGAKQNSSGGKTVPMTNPRTTAGARLPNLGRQVGSSNTQRSIQQIRQMITAKQKAIAARANQAKTDAAARAQNAKDQRALDALKQQLKTLK